MSIARLDDQGEDRRRIEKDERLGREQPQRKHEDRRAHRQVGEQRGVGGGMEDVAVEDLSGIERVPGQPAHHPQVR